MQKLDDWDRLEKIKRLKEGFNKVIEMEDLEASCQEDLEAKCQTDLEAGMPGNLPASSQRSAEKNVDCQVELDASSPLSQPKDLEATLPGKQLFRRVSDFPVPQRPTKLRGAELVKAEFLKRMDKTYFSIIRLQDIREEREHPEA